MGIAWPAALFGLAALLVPLVIHLLQRGEYRVVDVAITRFVPEHQSLRWRRFKVSQPLLLALRLLLVLLAVLLLAEPYRSVVADTESAIGWTLVSPRANIADADSTAARWLAPGFPLVSEPRPEWQPGQVWGLLTAADRAAPAGMPLTVIGPDVAAEFGPRRAVLSRAINWIPAPAVTAVAAIPDPIQINIAFEPSRRRDAKALEQAVAAWRDTGINASARLQTTAALDAPADTTVWLSAQPIPAGAGVWLTDQTSPTDALPVAFADDGSPSLYATVAGNQRIFYHAASLQATASSVRDPLFALRMLETLRSRSLVQPPADYRINVATVTGRSDSTREGRRSLLPLLIVLVLATALIERLLSAYTMRARRAD